MNLFTVRRYFYLVRFWIISKLTRDYSFTDAIALYLTFFLLAGLACDYTVTLAQNLISSSTNLINSYNHSILECKADWASANGSLIEQQELHRRAEVYRNYILIEIDSLGIWNDWAEVCTKLKFASQAVLVIFAVFQVFEGTAFYRCIRPFLHKLLVIGTLAFLYNLVEANYALHVALSVHK